MNKKKFDCETLLLRTHTSLLTSVEFTMDNLLKLKKERKKIFLVHYVSISTAFSNSFYNYIKKPHKNEEKKIKERERKKNEYLFSSDDE